MKVCINDICYSVMRLIKNGTSYENEFLENVRKNYNADAVINDNVGNVLICKRMLNYDIDPETNKWVCIDNSSDELLPESSSDEIETLQQESDAEQTI